MGEIQSFFMSGHEIRAEDRDEARKILEKINKNARLDEEIEKIGKLIEKVDLVIKKVTPKIETMKNGPGKAQKKVLESFNKKGYAHINCAASKAESISNKAGSYMTKIEEDKIKLKNTKTKLQNEIADLRSQKVNI